MVIIFILLGCWLLYFMLRNDKRKYIHSTLPAPRNLPLQYIYTIDEWYNLRCQFDKEIEKDWGLYRDGKMTNADYRKKTIEAMRRIIPRSDFEYFPNLMRYGCMLAAVRVMEKGYHAGMPRTDTPSNAAIKSWNHKELLIKKFSRSDDWMKCIPWSYDLIDLYPRGQLLDYMGCGRMTSSGWIPEYRKDAHCARYYSDLGASYKEEDRRLPISIMVERGFDGFTYTNLEPRDYGGLTKEEAKKKYEFINTRIDMSKPDVSIECGLYINKEHYEFGFNKERSCEYITID